MDYLPLLKALAPRVPPQRQRRQAEIIAAIAPVMEQTLAAYQINTKPRIAHFLAQVAHECAGFSTTEEFADGRAYEGRRDLGNVNPGDGPRYKGRGLIQLTGRFNYRLYGPSVGKDLENHPEIASDPVTSLRIACEYWKRNNLNALADADNINGITKRINGGYNGLEDRKAYLRKVNVLLSAAPETATAVTAAVSAAAATNEATADKDSGVGAAAIVAIVAIIVGIVAFFIIRAMRRAGTQFVPKQELPATDPAPEAAP